jgi:hypothetical protein
VHLHDEDPPRVVAVQVAFEKQDLKPGNHSSGATFVFFMVSLAVVMRCHKTSPFFFFKG